MATTFTFKGTDIADAAPAGVEIKVTGIRRALKKPVTRHKLDVPGKAGSWDFEGGVDQDYMITVDMAIVADTAANVMVCAAAMDTALDGKEDLIFSDSTGDVHVAQIFGGIELQPEGSGNVARCTIEFECDSST